MDKKEALFLFLFVFILTLLSFTAGVRIGSQLTSSEDLKSVGVKGEKNKTLEQSHNGLLLTEQPRAKESWSGEELQKHQEAAVAGVDSILQNETARAEIDSKIEKAKTPIPEKKKSENQHFVVHLLTAKTLKEAQDTLKDLQSKKWNDVYFVETKGEQQQPVFKVQMGVFDTLEQAFERKSQVQKNFPELKSILIEKVQP